MRLHWRLSLILIAGKSFFPREGNQVDKLMDLVEKGRKFFGACPLKTGPMVIVCKDGAAKSGLVCFLDNELDRLAKTGRVKHTDTVKAIRFMRSNTFDSIESFELGINGIIEMCNRKKK